MTEPEKLTMSEKPFEFLTCIEEPLATTTLTID
jgi:hypothetical protein